jgi:ADP-heptose:LPS heptosyltransferase
MLGAPSEREQVRACMPRTGAIDLCGALPLGEWFAALAGAEAVVANDSAAVHAAAALGRPLVGIYGATDPAAVGPYRRAESVVAPPGVAPSDPHAYRDARMVQRMELIPVDAVERRLDVELLRGPRW